ncbi:hypothetical protein PINS_up005044 [Pythium insidiosum]|nr:hypothetical protein PINS_up005044 [Pythium insidiosum]
MVRRVACCAGRTLCTMTTTRRRRKTSAWMAMKRKRKRTREKTKKERKEKKRRTKRKKKRKEEEEEEEEEDDDDEEEEDDDDEEDEEEDEEADETQRRRSSDRGRRGLAPMQKKLRRTSLRSSRREADAKAERDNRRRARGRGGDAESEAEDENDAMEVDDEDEQATDEAADTKPRTRGARSSSRRVDAPDGEGSVEEDGSTGGGGKGTRQRRGAAREGDGDNREDDDNDSRSPSASRAMEMDTVADAAEGKADMSSTREDDDTEETKSESTPQVTPSASPMRRGMAIDALISTTPTRHDSDSSLSKAVALDTTEVPFQDLLNQLRGAASEHELVEVLTDACSRLIKDGRHPNRLVVVSFLAAAKENPARFAEPGVLKYLLRLLRSKNYLNLKDGIDAPASKKNVTSTTPGAPSATIDLTSDIPLPVVIANILTHVLKDADSWPVDSFKVYIDDSLANRVWVDHELSRLFVRNIKTVLPVPASSNEGGQGNLPLAPVRPRFTGSEQLNDLRELAVNHLRSRLRELEKEKGGGIGAVRSMILTLSEFSCLPAVRVMAAEHLDAWLQNPSLKGPTRELLTRVVTGCTTVDPMDVQTVDLLLKMKLKSTMFQLKVETVTQLVKQNDTYLRRALQLFISRERPNNMGKDVDNMKMLQQLFRATRSPSVYATASASSGGPSIDELFFTAPITHPGTMASRELAFVFRDMASQSEVAPVLKTMIRKVVKQLTFDHVDIRSLCVGLLDHDGHWDALTKYADVRMLDYMALVTSAVWLVLLMRGAAVKSMQIQQLNSGSSAAPRSGVGLNPGASGNVAGAVSAKITGAQPIPRRNTPSGGSGLLNRGKLGSGSGSGITMSKSLKGTGGTSQPGGKSSPSNVHHTATAAATAGDSGGNSTTPSAQPLKTISSALRAREELLQAIAHVQRQSLIACHGIFRQCGLSGASSFERSLFDIIVKKLLLLEIPSDVQPTEHDKTTFLSTKEDIPIHEDTLEMMVALLLACHAVDRVDALRLLETIVVRAAEGHIHREELWGSRIDDLAEYSRNGGVLGLELRRTQFVIDLFHLTLWGGESQHNLDHKFCFSGRFWICCSILLIIAAFNPTTVGAFLWKEIPTLRCMMQMIITGRYEFPPVDVAASRTDPALFGGHRDSFTDLRAANNQLLEYEKHVMRTVGAASGSTFDDNLMLFELQGVARQPPAAMLQHLSTLDRRFHLGIRLRQSREQDFLMEMVSADQESHGSTWWIAEIVCEDVATLQYLPSVCLCRLLLIARRGAVTSLHGESVPRHARQLNRLVPRLERKLSADITQRGISEDDGASVVRFFLTAMTTADARDRCVASNILHVLATRDDTDDDGASTPKSESDAGFDDTTMSAEATQTGDASSMNFDWLGALRRLPCYSHIRDDVFVTLEALLDREASAPALQRCIQSLYAFIHDEDEANNDAAIEASMQLAVTFGRLLATRPFIARHVLSTRATCEMLGATFWSAIAGQLSGKVEARPQAFRAATECKVLYVVDSTQNVREIQLPIQVVHGAIEVLCAISVATGESGSGSSALVSLSDALFPPTKDSGTLIASTGVIATKDPRLYPDSLLKKVVRQCHTQDHMMLAAARAMSMEELWQLTTTDLQSRSLHAVLEALVDGVRASESRALSALNSPSQSIAARDISSLLSSTQSSLTQQLDESARERLDFLIKWLSDKCDGSASANEEMIDDSLEEELISQGFSTLHVAAKQRTPVRPTWTSGAKLTSDDEMMSIASPRIHCSLLTSSQGEVNSVLRGDKSTGVASKLAALITADCEVAEGVTDKSRESTTWSRSISLLHCARAACNSSRGAVLLGQGLQDIASHITKCKSRDHRAECVSFICRTIEMAEASFSTTAVHNLLETIVWVSRMRGLSSIEVRDRDAMTHFHRIIRKIIVFVQAAVEASRVWLSDITVRNIVSLLMTAQTLERVLKLPTEVQFDIDILLVLMQRLDKPTVLIDAVLSTPPTLLRIPSAVLSRSDIQRAMLEALYFYDPNVVAAQLNALQPTWQWDLRSQLAVGVTPKIGTSIDSLLMDLTKPEVSDAALEQLREVAIRQSLLVLSRISVLFDVWKNGMSLSLLYDQAKAISQIIVCLDILRPHMRGHSEDALVPTFQMIFEVMDVIVHHQATEFPQLATAALYFVVDALDADRSGASHALASARKDWRDVFRSVTALYESWPSLAGSAEALESFFDERSGPSGSQALVNARNKSIATSDEQRQVMALIAKANVTSTSTTAAPTADFEAGFQLLLQLLSKAQEQRITNVPILRASAQPLAALLKSGEMNKSSIKLLCQVLLGLMRHDASAIETVMPCVVASLRSLRPALRESAFAFVTEFLSFADLDQRRQLLRILYDDPSDIAKAKLMAFVKSAAFKASLAA